jgi:ribosomal protein L37E
MRAPYAWRCHICDRSNEAEVTACTSCGFPARATGKQIEVAKAAPGTPTDLHKSADGPSKISILEVLGPLSVWRKVVAVAGMLLAGGGGVWLKVTFSLVEAALSIGAFVAGLLILALAFVGMKPPPVVSDPLVAPRGPEAANESAAVRDGA